MAWALADDMTSTPDDWKQLLAEDLAEGQRLQQFASAHIPKAVMNRVNTGRLAVAGPVDRAAKYRYWIAVCHDGVAAPQALSGRS